MPIFRLLLQEYVIEIVQMIFCVSNYEIIILSVINNQVGHLQLQNSLKCYDQDRNA